ncbi:MAG: 4Fe-4S double cluster binding domain-containing protein [Candidatus Geothermincolia bacterium]
MDKFDFVREVIASLDVSGWGVSRVNPDSPLPDEMKPSADAGSPRSAVTLYTAYELPVEFDPLEGGEYDESVFHEVLLEAREAGFAQLYLLGTALDTEGIPHKAVPGGQDPETLLGAFSQKRAAVQAGLGWIGRSSLFVTELYGPRVKVFTVLLDLEPPGAAVFARAACGSCRDCVEACPHGFLTGAAWSSGSSRERLIDAVSCSRTMERMGESTGRKHSCGLCLLACPLGRRRTTIP